MKLLACAAALERVIGQFEASDKPIRPTPYFRPSLTILFTTPEKGLFDMLPILRTGEAVIVGEAISLRVRTLIDAPPKNRRPDSTDPRVVARGGLEASGDGYDGPGGWNQRRDNP